ncbi:hypothetical protein [Methylobacterium nigriterrae]|uniref:hypothetical protein n=1 Tax=Methylobacterium nigriterrae TaxID=3127512 RepID=UPI00301356AF
MANYFVSLEAADSDPGFLRFEERLTKIDPCCFMVIRDLWFLKTTLSKQDVFNYLRNFTEADDRLIVIVACDCSWANLLVPGDHLRACWDLPAPRSG